jgi:hypothetical protein
MAQIKILGSQIEQTTLDPNLFLPAQTGNAGKSLVTDGTLVSWGTPVTVNGSTFEYLVSTTTSPPPATGNIRYNNASQTASTLIYVHKNEASPVITLTNFYRTILPNTIMLIQSKTTPSQYQRWLITQVLEDINHFTWTVTMLDSNGAIFTNTQPVLMSYSFNGTGAISLDNLSDVQIVAPTTGQTLVYNGSISQWVNTSAVGALSLDDLSDVAIATPVLGNALVYDGTIWKNSPNWIYSKSGQIDSLTFKHVQLDSYDDGAGGYAVILNVIPPDPTGITDAGFTVIASNFGWQGPHGATFTISEEPIAGGSYVPGMNMHDGYIHNVSDPVGIGDAANKNYIDTQLQNFVERSGDLIYGELNFSDVDGVDPDNMASIIYAKPDATSNPELQLFGGDWHTTFNDSPKTHGVRVGGSYIALESPDISITLHGAQVGGRVVVAGITERGNAILGVEPPPIPDYVVSATGTTGVDIYLNGGAVPSPWIDLTSALTIGQAIPPSQANVYFETLIENTGKKPGVFELGVSLNGAAPISANSIDYNIGPAVKQIFANTAINANLVPIGTTVKLQARVITSGNTFNLFARNTERPSLIKVTVNGSGGGGGATSLGQLSDVSLTSPTNNQVLTYNGSLWVNANPSGGSTSWPNGTMAAPGFPNQSTPSTGMYSLLPTSEINFAVGGRQALSIIGSSSAANAIQINAQSASADPIISTIGSATDGPGTGIKILARGAGGATGAGGNLQLTAGDGGLTTGNGGNVIIGAGNGTVGATGNGGNVTITLGSGGTGISSSAGNLNITGGTFTGAGTRSTLTITNTNFKIDNSLAQVVIDNTGSWKLGGAAGTAGQVLTSAGPAAQPTWTTVSGGGIPEAPVDGAWYSRKNAAWATTALDDITNVIATTPADGDMLVYSNFSWRNSTTVNSLFIKQPLAPTSFSIQQANNSSGSVQMSGQVPVQVSSLIGGFQSSFGLNNGTFSASANSPTQDASVSSASGLRLGSFSVPASGAKPFLYLNGYTWPTVPGAVGQVLKLSDTNVLTFANDAGIPEAPLNGNVYARKDATWVTTPQALSALSDVTILNPTNTQVLTYNGTKWVNAPASGGGGAFLPLAGGTMDFSSRIYWGDTSGFSVGVTHPDGNYNLYDASQGINMYAGNGFIFEALGPQIATFTPRSGSGQVFVGTNLNEETSIYGLPTTPTIDSEATSKIYVDTLVAAGPASIDGGTY